MFVLDPLLGHVTIKIRGLIYEKMFKQSGWEVDYVSRRPKDAPRNARKIRRLEDQIVYQARQFDVVYLLKVPSLYLVKELKRRTNAKVIFDLTDTLWHPLHQAVGWQDLNEILRSVDAIFSENDYICAYGRRFNPCVYSIPVCTQIELFEQLRQQIARRSDNKIVLGWVGSGGTVSALHTIHEALEPLFQRHANLELRILGCPTPALLPSFRHVRFTATGDYNEEQMVREILNMDIGLFPPPLDIEDYCVRGALKAMLYMSAGVPPVCQRAGDCVRIIEDGLTGMLADTMEEWSKKIEILIINPELRKEIGQRAAVAIRQEHSLEYVFKILSNTLSTVISSPPQPQQQETLPLSIWHRLPRLFLSK